MKVRAALAFAIGLLALLATLPAPGQPAKDKPLPAPLNVNPPLIATDKSVLYDYDIVYVRAPRFGDERRGRWAEFPDPTRMEPGPTSSSAANSPGNRCMLIKLGRLGKLINAREMLSGDIS